MSAEETARQIINGFMQSGAVRAKYFFANNDFKENVSDCLQAFGKDKNCEWGFVTTWGENWISMVRMRPLEALIGRNHER